MCEYCEKQMELKSCNFGGSAGLFVCGNVLDIYGDDRKFHIFKHIYRPRFLIKYCPMCGRELEVD